MRFGFIMGGIVGAALTMYFTRNQNENIQQKVGKISDQMRKTFDTAGFLMKEVVLTGKQNNDDKQTNADVSADKSGSNSDAGSTGLNKNNYGQIEQLAKQDPEAHEQMEKILQETR